MEQAQQHPENTTPPDTSSGSTSNASNNLIDTSSQFLKTKFSMSTLQQAFFLCVIIAVLVVHSNRGRHENKKHVQPLKKETRIICEMKAHVGAPAAPLGFVVEKWRSTS
jgi:hypothetical protein